MNNSETKLYIGLMSGTSLDGVDAVLVQFSNTTPLQVIAHTYKAMPKELRSNLLSLNQKGENELHRSALAANQLIQELYAPAVAHLLQSCNIMPHQIKAIGAHGQTVRHLPQLGGHKVGYSLQLNAPALLAELTGIKVISDFRSRDIAAGGQGAPLVPAFHADFFSQKNKTIALLNLGGIANLTLLFSNGDVLGFDCGPANALMDEWCESNTGRPYDNGGQWAATGTPNQTLLSSMLSEPYFLESAPKSTGRDLFNTPWLQKHLERSCSQNLTPEDIQASLLELTARTAIEALRSTAPQVDELLICGGGAYNNTLLLRLQELLGSAPIKSTEAYGLPPNQVESAAFAWLAKQCTEGRTANLPTATGAKGKRILGAIYQA